MVERNKSSQTSHRTQRNSFTFNILPLSPTVNHGCVRKGVWLKVCHPLRVQSIHCQQHFLRFRRGIVLLALCMGIDDRVKDVRIGLQVRIVDGVRLVEVDHFCQQGVSSSCCSFLSTLGVGIDHRSVRHDVWFHVRFACIMTMVHKRQQSFRLFSGIFPSTLCQAIDDHVEL